MEVEKTLQETGSSEETKTEETKKTVRTKKTKLEFKRYDLKKFESYKVKKGDEGAVHVLGVMDQYDFDGEPKFKPFVAMYEPNKEWKIVLKNRSGVTFISVLHSPKGTITIADWDKLQAEKLSKLNK